MIYYFLNLEREKQKHRRKEGREEVHIEKANTPCQFEKKAYTTLSSKGYQVTKSRVPSRKRDIVTVRDWKLTLEAHKTGDPFHVMRISGHKTLQSLMFYIEFTKVVFGPAHDEYTV